MITRSQGIATAIHMAGTSVVTCVPALGAIKIFEDICTVSHLDMQFSFHEEVAYSIAHGAALSGVRSAAVMKVHGLMKAANSISDSLFSGTTAACLLIVVDDPLGIQSDSITDTETFLKGLMIPYLKANTSSFDLVNQGIMASESFQLPVALLIPESWLAEKEPESKLIRFPSPPPYVRDVFRHMLIPPFIRYQSEIFKARRIGKDLKKIPRPRIITVPDDLPSAWKQPVSRYLTLFSAFKSIRGDFVAGDIGYLTAFALEPYRCIDVCTCMGGSISLAIGAELGGKRNTWAVTGDFSFVSAGYLGLLEVLSRSIPLKVLVLVNGMAETTGGQMVDDKCLTAVTGGYCKQIRWITDPDDETEILSVFSYAMKTPGLQIILVDYRSEKPLKPQNVCSM